MTTGHVRWHQRLSNFNKAIILLEKAVKLSKERELSALEEQGIIQSFEVTHELAWNVMKDYIQSQGNVEIHGSKGATKEAFKIGLISEGDSWMEMISSRNLTFHTYNEKIAESIVKHIPAFLKLFVQFQHKMEQLRSGEQKELFGAE